MSSGVTIDNARRTVFIVSDRTGITAETLGHSLLTQFDSIDFEQVSLPFIDTVDKARAAAERIHAAGIHDGHRPIVFSTLVDPEVRAVLNTVDALFFDFFATFIGPLEKVLQRSSSHMVGRSHGLADLRSYMTRMEAINYSLNHDDGLNSQGYEHADMILVGISRSGKTPTCLYMAMSFGIRAANYPLTEEDLGHLDLPPELAPYRERLYGLSIDPRRLREIRQERRPDSRYASLAQCRYEVSRAESLFRREGITCLNTSFSSIEEIATAILHQAGLKRRLF
ncbi:MAG TPA: pyruvate, water dikinase regulatory protein [Gammaproteobacteria bacterium]